MLISFRRCFSGKAKYELLQKTKTNRSFGLLFNEPMLEIFSPSWLNPLLSIGNKRPLQTEDLYDNLNEEKTKCLTEELER